MSEWISVKERLPSDEHDGRYVIVHTWSSAKLDYIVEADIWIGGTFEFWGEKVADWMPLPAPPEDI